MEILQREIFQVLPIQVKKYSKEYRNKSFIDMFKKLVIKMK